MIILQTLLQLSCLPLFVSAVLLPPKSLKFFSENFQHILTWEDPNDEPSIYYKVEYSQDYRPFVSTRYCSNISVARCDLTKDFTDIFGNYEAKVQIFTHNDSSLPIISANLNPIAQTLLGPPVVDVIADDLGIQISIHPPVSYLWSEKEQSNVTMLSDDVYPIMTYRILLARPTQTLVYNIQVYEENFTDPITTLLASTRYCVSVNASAMFNDHSVASPEKCVFTKAAKYKRFSDVNNEWSPLVFYIPMEATPVMEGQEKMAETLSHTTPDAKHGITV
ncbi:interferon alpha/beta receptor 2-like isoform X2 [Hyperolius riggenbachi]|uniref:interferon alpha/beta receptor 2-like isoform X2 n=1 Tax=Hyperolius riggenbachi TaxID=752182 RepID=UPI0035A36B90